MTPTSPRRLAAVRLPWFVALVALAACSGGSGGGGGPTGPVPAVTALTFPTALAGDLALQVTIADAATNLADLRLEVSRDGGATWADGHYANGSSGTGLMTSATGTTSTIVWDSLRDAGFRDLQNLVLRATPLSANGTGTPLSVAVPALDNLHWKAAHVTAPMIHYGSIDAATALVMKHADLVVVHPFAGNVPVATIREIQQGLDPLDPGDDVLVLAYLSVGEDSRTVGVNATQMLADARFVGDGSGPRIDPRGPGAGGQPLTGLPPLGLPTNSPGGTHYASYYLDDNSVDGDPGHVGDGIPDRSATFGGCFVNPGDPAWYAVLDAMTFDGPDGLPGIHELLRTDLGRGYGCDGLFLDTFDTCAPNSFTDASSPNQTEFEWTANGFREFTATLRGNYPDKLVLQNRGMFLFDARFPHYAVTTRPFVDLVLLESYRLDSSTVQQFDPYFSADNRYNLGPKLVAESVRADGFCILSLGYAEGPGIDQNTLLGTSTVGLQTLLDDIAVANGESGFAHYLTNASLTLANTFVQDHLTADISAPVWSSTYNANQPGFPTPPNPPTARPGIQQLVPGNGQLTARWDVALDQSGARYALYLQATPFDFIGDPMLSAAQRTVLEPEVGAGYASGPGPNVYPFEQVITGLQNGTTYHACIRAFDALGHEEQNQVVLSAAPTGQVTIAIDGSFADWQNVPLALTDGDDAPVSAGPDWLDIAICNDATNVYVRFTSAHAFNLDGSPTYGFSRTFVFLDVDGDAATGWPVGGLGSDLAVAGDQLFTQSSSVFNTGGLGGIAALPTTNVTECELAIPWTQIDAIAPGAVNLRFVFVDDDGYDAAPDSGFLTYTAVR